MGKKELKLSGANLEVIYERTKYDDEFIGGKAIKICDIIRNSGKVLSCSDIMNLFGPENIKFAFLRISPSNLEKRKLMKELGFYYIGTVAEVYLNDLHKVTFQKYGDFSHEPFESRKDIGELKEIILSNFYHGRFYEDPYLNHLAKDRLGVILEKLCNDDETNILIVVSKSGLIAGYFIHRQMDGFEELVLAGTNREAGYPGMGDDLWNYFHDHLKVNGVKRVKTTVTLTNLGVLNIYARLGYKFLRPMEEYHFLC